MSLLSLFSRKSQLQPLESSDAVPATPEKSAPADDPVTRLRDERIERRERLFGVVREALVQVGVLTASFKFKILALDDYGQQFLVMVDLAPPWGAETAWRVALEKQIIQAAHNRHQLVITAVYWRSNPDLTVWPVGQAPAAEAPAVPTAPGALPASGGLYEPLHADEVAAFQQALEAAARTPTGPGAVQK